MNKQLEALRMPDRIRRDWNSAVMRTCESCDSWHMTIIHNDGSAMCAGCCDAYYTDQLKETLTAALGRNAELEAKLETADKLQDSAFRHGLQHGFSYGQTNDQAGFEQAMKAYSNIAATAAGGTVEGE